VPVLVALGPLPPDDLVIRMGVDPEWHGTPAERAEVFHARGGDAYDDIVAAAAIGDWDGRRVLDFGSGPGRILRWFVPRMAEGAVLEACDIHAESIAWMRSAYPAGIRLFVNAADPPLDAPGEHYDLVYCGSVFSHLPDWAPWLLELRRVLKPGGMLVASIHGRGFWDEGVAGSRGVPWDEDRTGLLVERYGDDFETSWGPAVYASEWWLRAHWGRALDIVRYEPSGFALRHWRHVGQALVAAVRPDAPPPGIDELRAPSSDARELPAALRAQWLAYEELAHVHRPEIQRLTRELEEAARTWRELSAEAGAVWEELTAARRRLAELEAG
jgi:SAM-dependent methyltransferase